MNKSMICPSLGTLVQPGHSTCGCIGWENICGLFMLIAVQAELPDFSL